jgi:predicted alpha/beta superfamily hydrolase
MNWVYVIILCFFSINLFSQSADGKKELITIQSDVYKKERKVAVFLPSYYEEFKDESFQVIYLLDGQWEPLFNYVANSVNYLRSIGEMGNAIVVGIYTEDRAKEFLPIPQNEEEKQKWESKKSYGYSELLDKHLINEVFPLIQKKYNTNQYKIGIGHSLGGTYIINSFADDKNIFNSFIAISPNLEFDKYGIQKKIKNLLTTKKEINSYVCISVGDNDETEKKFSKGIHYLDSIMSTSKVKGLKYKFDYLKNATHSNSILRELPEALLEYSKIIKKPKDSQLSEMLLNTSVPFTVSLKNHYKSISSWLGYNYQPSENEINSFAYLSLKNKNPKDGLNIINWALEIYPNSINLYDSKAEMLENLNNKKEAIDAAKEGLKKLKSLNLQQEDNDYYKEMLEKHLQ